MAESEEELKSLFLRVKEENEKVACQHSKNGFQSHHFIANRRGKSENCSFFFFFLLYSKITVDGDYSHEIKRHLLLGRKAMTNLDSILKSREITLETLCIVKATFFPVVMVGRKIGMDNERGLAEKDAN